MAKIVVLFPGIGYHCDKPLLYYSSRLASEYGYDKQIRLDYTYTGGNIRGNPGQILLAIEALYKQTVEQLKAVNWDEYDQILFISKSIGTTMAARYALRNQLKCRKVFYTPIEQTFLEDVSDALVFTGTYDQWIDYRIVVNKCRSMDIPMRLFDKANHSLETTDSLRNIAILDEVMTRTKEFIQKP